MKELAQMLRNARGFNCGGKADVRDNIDARRYLKEANLALLPDEFFSLVKYVNGVKGDFGELYAIDPSGQSGFTDAVRANESLRLPDGENAAVLGENTFDYLVYDTTTQKYQLRDREDGEIMGDYGELSAAVKGLLRL